ncbi:MAG: hypothetical protein ACQKBU_07860 [Verrucomicrobiales bacterium]
MFQNNQPDQWWLNLDSVTEDEPMTLMQIQSRLKSGDYGAPFVMHASRADDENAAWIDVELGEDSRPKPSKPQTSSPSSPPATSANQSTETIGVLLLLIPLVGAVLAWFWIGSMNLLQGPASSLNAVIAGVVLSTAILIGVEANLLGMGRSKAKGDTGPLAWGILTVLLWIVAYPWYLGARKKYGAKNMVFGGVLVALLFVFAAGSMTYTIETKREEVIGIYSGDRAPQRDYMKEINDSVIQDAISQYNTVVKRGDPIESWVHAGIVAAAYLQAGNEAEYNRWKDIEAKHQSAAGM